jgi:hypothetical protein
MSGRAVVGFFRVHLSILCCEFKSQAVNWYLIMVWVHLIEVLPDHKAWWTHLFHVWPAKKKVFYQTQEIQ